ncbi:hypothetical protein O6H91_13G093300 [Diphasiastrum complanatum]|uniref:Uncharacterized protein n=2 Tax=Diphasiastrum complanatum TaxID=34168 RepID=A0ACC2BXI2_DIPCM|nr:hypothetical protein O6H91_13G093300 [Diphasiastrum complanatum]KAJ7534411.1 hypothetical protein O6H91_13G093300 [Diphasiastrum complanatum]
MANLDAFDAYFRTADADQDGNISGAEAVAFFKGSSLPQVTLAKIWQFSDQGRRGFLSRAEFYNALKLVTVAQSGRELTPEIVKAALVGPASSQIPAPRIVSGATAIPPSGGYGVAARVAGPINPVQQAPLGEGLVSQSQPSKMIQATPVPLPVQSKPGFSVQRIPTTGLGVDPWVPSKPISPSLQTQSPVSLVAANFQPKPSPPVPQQGLQDAFEGPAFQASATEAFTSAPFKAPPVVGTVPYIPAATSTSTAGVANVLPNGTSNVEIAVNNGIIRSDSLSSSFPEGASKAPASVVGSAFSTEANFGAETFSAFSGGLSNNQAVTGPSQPAFASAGNPVSFQSKSDGVTLFPTSVSPATGKEVQALAPQVASVNPIPADIAGPGLVVAPGHGVTGTWPKMTQSDIQRYTRVFTEVDTDKDGKILGEQARDLFLSWRLPREVLKQVWDLSDQDADSMLSFPEFCTALYLMERYREGKTLPSVLPVGIYLEDDLQWQPNSSTRLAEAQTAVAQHSAGYNVSAWQQNPIAPGLVSQVPQRPAAQLLLPTHSPQGAVSESGQVYKSKAPLLEINLVNQLNKDEQESLKHRHKEAEEADKKVHDLEKVIMDSQQKTEFYRMKLQEVILFKSRCDNRLAEATERAAADKNEVEILAKKYDDKFRQAGEVNSRLLAEEAAFRDIQERKMELYKAISQIEQGGNASSLLQTRADRISDDLDELKKAFTTRVKQLGLRLNSSSSTEPGFGWQPGMQESSIEWDGDWDKFDDEGFTSIQELMDDMTVATTTSTSTSKVNPSWDEGNLFTDEGDFTAGSPAENKSDFTAGSPAENKSDFTAESPAENKSDGHIDEAPVPRQGSSGIASPGAESEAESGKSGIESPQYDFFSPRAQSIGKSVLGNSATARKSSERDENVHEFQGHDDGDATFWPPRGSISNSISGDVSADIMPSWASTFDGHDEEVNSEVRASWALKSNPLTEAPYSNHQTEPSFISHSFGDSLDFASLRVSSPARGNGVTEHEYDYFGNSGSKEWQDKSIDVFSTDNSMPGTPLFTVISPEKTSSVLGEDFNRGRDSFSRFDSIASVKDGDRVRGLGSFDDSDPFADTGPFRVMNQAPKSSDNWSTF